MVRHSGQFKKGSIPWNKGFCHLSEDAKKRISESKKGKKHTEEFKKALSNKNKGKNNPNYGRKHIFSEESRKRMSETHKGDKGYWYGKKLSDEHCKKLSESRKGNIPWNKGKEFLKGEMNPRWLGGISFEPYCLKFNDRLKEQIRKRGNYTCQLCGIKQEDYYRKLDVHHIHYDKPNCEPDLIALCMKCNQKVNMNRNYYENLFMQKLKARNINET